MSGTWFHSWTKGVEGSKAKKRFDGIKAWENEEGKGKQKETVSVS